MDYLCALVDHFNSNKHIKPKKQLLMNQSHEELMQLTSYCYKNFIKDPHITFLSIFFSEFPGMKFSKF